MPSGRRLGSLFLLMFQEHGVGQPTFQYFVNYEIADTLIMPAIFNMLVESTHTRVAHLGKNAAVS